MIGVDENGGGSDGGVDGDGVNEEKVLFFSTYQQKCQKCSLNTPEVIMWH